MTWIDRPARTNAVVAGIAMLFQLMALPMWRPLTLPDEAGYLLNARRITEGTSPSGLNYFPGYSAFLSPVTWITDDIETMTRLAQVVNGLLGATTAVLAVALARRFGRDLDEPTLTVIGVIAAAYPGYRLFAASALSENLLVPWTTGLCLLMDRAVNRRRVGDALAFGLMAGLSLSIHTRALALVVAGGASALIFLRGRILLGSLVGLIAGAAAAASFVSLILQTPVDDGVGSSSAGELLRASASMRGVVDVGSSAGGQIFYLVAATAGLAALGAWTFFALSTERTTPRNLRAISMLAALTMIFSLGISSLFLARRVGDFAIYGRYGEGVLLPFLIAGLVSVASAPRRSWQRLRYIVVYLPLLAAALVVVRGPEAFNGRMLLLNISGVFPVVDAVGSIRLSTLTLYGVGFALLVSVLLRWRFVPGGLCLAGIFLLIASFSIQRSAAAIEVLDQQDDLRAVIVDVTEPSDCVALDVWQLPDRWHIENYRLRVDSRSFALWSSASTDAPCSDLVVSQRSDLDDRFPGARVIAVEPFGRLALWVLPGQRQAAIEADRAIFEDPLAPLGVDQVITIELEVPPDSLAADVPFEIAARLSNAGPAALFPERSFSTVEGAVNLGIELRTPDQPDLRRHEPLRIGLPAIIGPSGAVDLTRTVRLRDIDPTVRPGTYLLVATIVQEGVGWTDHADVVTLQVAE